MKGPETKPSVKIEDMDGNAFSVMGHVKQALKRAGADKEYIDQYINDATMGDYNCRQSGSGGRCFDLEIGRKNAPQPPFSSSCYSVCL